MMQRLLAFWERWRQDLLLAAGIALLVFIAFGLGRVTAPALPKGGLSVSDLPFSASLESTSAAPAASQKGSVTGGTIIASKSGTKYYLENCSGVTRIKQENRVSFSSEAEALAAGYAPAKNCPGLQGR